MLTSIEYKLRLKHCSKNNLSRFLSKTVLYKDRFSLRDMHDMPEDDHEDDHKKPEDHEDEHEDEAPKRDKDFWFVMTSDAPDREGDRIIQTGLDTNFLEKYGSVLWGHRAEHPDYVLGKICDIVREEHRTLVNVEFAKEEANPMAARVRKMVEGGIVNGMSIGFLLHEFSEVSDREGIMPLDIWRSEAVETSITPVPMNVQAVIERQGGAEERKELIEIIEQTIEETPAGRVEDVQVAATLALKELNSNRVYSLPKVAYKEIAHMCVRTLLDIN